MHRATASIETALPDVRKHGGQRQRNQWVGGEPLPFTIPLMGLRLSAQVTSDNYAVFGKNLAESLQDNFLTVA